MTMKQKATATSAKGAKRQATTGKNEKGENVMARSATITITETELKAIINEMVGTLVAGLSQAKATTTKATTKTTKKAEAIKVAKVNPVKVAIEKEQKELALAFNGKSYGSKASGDFIAFYRCKENGSYTRIGHFNKVKGLFWFTKKSLAFRDWSYIKSQLTKYSNAADFSRNGDRFAKAGIKCPSDFSKVNWEVFLNSGVFC